MRWFTSEKSSLADLIGKTFSSDQENADWEALMAGEEAPDNLKVQAARLKINLIAGYRHDLRSQFAVGTEHECRSALDFDRHAINEAAASRMRLDILEQTITVKERGIRTI
jgi:hypothetical protein